MELKHLSKKNILYFSAGLFILIVGIITINALISGTKHSQANVLVSVDGYTMTLQEAINNDYLEQGASSPSSSGTTSVSVGHSPSEIWVSVNGAESTLAAAIAADNLCGSTSVPYTSSINPGHLASEIEVVIGGSTKTLQQAIDAGNFCVTYSYYYSGWSACGVCSVPTCGGGYCTKTRTCGKYANGVFQENVACSYCGGICSDSTTTCNTQPCITTFDNPLKGTMVLIDNTVTNTAYQWCIELGQGFSNGQRTATAPGLSYGNGCMYSGGWACNNNYDSLLCNDCRYNCCRLTQVQCW